MGAPNKAELRVQQDLAALPTERVRALAASVTQAWAPFTDEERIDLLAMISHERGPLDALAVEKMLTATDGNIGLAARKLGVARRTLQNRMRDFNMPRGKPGGKFK